MSISIASMVLRVVVAGMLFVTWMQPASGIGDQARPPRAATSESPWNVLAYGGKGEMHGAPICHSLAYFSKSPLPMDFDSDFFGVHEADLITRAKVTLLGAIDGQRIYDIKQTVARKTDHSNTPGTLIAPTMKILVMERSLNEFCDIYQNQYTYDPTRESDEAIILNISGHKVLKTFETDRHTWFLAYWAIKDHRPLLLNIDPLHTAIGSVSPPGALPFRAALNVTGSHFTAEISRDSPQQDALGRIDLQIAIQGDKMIALRKTWVPTLANQVR